MEQLTFQCAVCQNPSERKCTGCQIVSYCSKDHQKQHWAIHKADCLTYTVATNNKLGRHLIAARDIKANTIIFSELPYVIGPKFHQNYEESQTLVPCLGCYEPVLLNRCEKCPKCQWPVCSDDCPGLNESHNHAAECSVLSVCYKTYLSNIDPKFYRYSALIILRSLILQRKYPKKWAEMMKLESHVNSRTKGTEEYQEVEELASYLQNNFLSVLGEIESAMSSPVLEDTSNDAIHRIAGILDVNALDIYVNDDITLSGLYPTFSLLEHSCFPNTYYFFDLQQNDSKKKFKITLKAAADIKKGDHLSTMYSHALWGTKLRRKHLLECKYFNCDCIRCSDATELGSFISGLRCLSVKSEKDSNVCNGIQLPKDPLDLDSDWVCNLCNTPISGENVDFLEAKMSVEVEKAITMPPNIEKAEDTLNKLSNFLHPNHYLLYQLKHSLIQMYGMQDGYKTDQLTESQLQNKVKICRELLDVHSIIDPYNVRVQLYIIVVMYELHTALLELAKRDFKLDMKAKAISGLKEVKDVLKRCFDIVKNELQTRTGFKLSILIETSNTEIDSWMKANNITL